MINKHQARMKKYQITEYSDEYWSYTDHASNETLMNKRNNIIVEDMLSIIEKPKHFIVTDVMGESRKIYK